MPGRTRTLVSDQPTTAWATKVVAVEIAKHAEHAPSRPIDAVVSDCQDRLRRGLLVRYAISPDDVDWVLAQSMAQSMITSVTTGYEQRKTAWATEVVAVQIAQSAEHSPGRPIEEIVSDWRGRAEDGLLVADGPVSFVPPIQLTHTERDSWARHTLHPDDVDWAKAQSMAQSVADAGFTADAYGSL